MPAWSSLVTCIVIICAAWLLQKYVMQFIFIKLASYYHQKHMRISSEIVSQIATPVRHLFFTIAVLFACSYAYNVSVLDHRPLTRILNSLVIWYTFKALYNVGNYFAQHPAGLQSKLHLNMENVLFPFVTRVFNVLLIVLGFGLIAHEWGYELSGLITGLGISGLAVALGARDMLAHIFGGIAIALDKPFTVGDWISIDSGKIEGVVEDMSFRSTKIRSFDKAFVSIPNAVLANQSIHNWSRRQNRRVQFNLAVPHAIAPEKVQRFITDLKQLISETDGVDKDGLYVNFDNYSSSSLDIAVEFLTNTTDYVDFLDIKQHVNLKILELLKQKDITLAYPSQNIYIEKATSKENG